MSQREGDGWSLARLAGPLVVSNVLSVLALAVDTAMVSGLPNAESALAALGYATQLVYLTLVALTGISVGAVALISRARGAGEPVRATHVLGQAHMLVLAVGVVMTAVGFGLAPPLLGLLGATDSVHAMAMEYLRPLFLGFSFNGLALLYAAALRAVGNTWIALVVGLVANALNVLINYGVILGHFGMPALGVAGAAFGTLTSQVFTAMVLGVVLRRGAAGISLRPRLRSLDPGVLWQLTRVGAPAALDFTVLNLGYLGVMGLLGAGGGVAVAAHSIGMRVLVLAFVPSRAIAQAAAALVGQHLGAECRPCAARVVRLALGQNMVLLALVVTMLWFGAEPLVAALGVDSAGELASATTTWLRIIALSLPILAVNITFVGMMQGAGLTSTSLGINAFSTLLVQLPAGWLAGYGLGLGPPGVWLCIPIGFGLRATMGAWVYRLWLR